MCLFIFLFTLSLQPDKDQSLPEGETPIEVLGKNVPKFNNLPQGFWKIKLPGQAEDKRFKGPSDFSDPQEYYQYIMSRVRVGMEVECVTNPSNGVGVVTGTDSSTVPILVQVSSFPLFIFPYLLSSLLVVLCALNSGATTAALTG